MRLEKFMIKDFLKTLLKNSLAKIPDYMLQQSNNSYSCPFELSKNPLSKF